MMSNFFRDLSPHRAHEPSRAVPVLPSPFEAMHPLRAVTVDAMALDATEDHNAIVRPSDQPQRDAQAPAPALQRPRDMAPTPAAVVQRSASTLSNNVPT